MTEKFEKCMQKKDWKRLTGELDKKTKGQTKSYESGRMLTKNIEKRKGRIPRSKNVEEYEEKQRTQISKFG